MFTSRFYILEILVETRICSIICDLDGDYFKEDSQGEEANPDEAPMVEFFRDMYSIITADCAPKVFDYIKRCLVACIQDSDTISPAVLDCMLINLVPSLRDQRNDEVYKMTAVVIRSTVDALMDPISTFLHSLLNGSACLDGTFQTELSEKKHLHSLIYEMHKVHENLMLKLIPNLSDMLGAEELEERKSITNLLGRIFSSPKGNALKHVACFDNWLARFNDIDKEVRMLMIGIGAKVARNRPETFPKITANMLNMLIDQDSEVRDCAINDLCTLTIEDLTLVSPEIMGRLIGRVQDPKEENARHAMTGLAQIYSKWIGKMWEAPGKAVCADPTGEKKLLAVPANIIGRYCVAASKDTCRQLLDNILLPTKASARTRAYGLQQIYSSLDDQMKKGLNCMLRDRKQGQTILKHYLKLLPAANKSSGKGKASKAGLQERQRSADNTMMMLFTTGCLPKDKKLMQSIKALGEQKDLKVYKLLALIANPKTDARKGRKAGGELFQKLGSKTPLAKAMRPMVRLCSMLTVDCTVVAELFKLLHTTMEPCESGSARASALAVSEASYILDLLKLTSSYFPEAFEDSIDVLLGLMGHKAEAIKQVALTVLNDVTMAMAKNQAGAGAAGDDSEDEEETLSPARPKLLRMCTKGTEQQAKFAVRVLSNLTRAGDPCFPKLIKELVSPKTMNHSNPKLPTVLSSLKSFAKLPALRRVYLEHAEEIKEFALEEVLLRSEPDAYTLDESKGKSATKKKARSKARTVSRDCQLRCQAIKLLTAHLICSHKHLKTQAASEESDGEDGSASAMDALTEEATPIVEQLLSLVEDGELQQCPTSSDTDRASLRGAAACALLKLMMNERFTALLNAQAWRDLGYTMLDPDYEVRRAFISKLGLAARGKAKQGNVSQKFLSYLVIASDDPEKELAKLAKDGLENHCKRLRLLLEKAETGQVGGQLVDLSIDTERHNLMPESMVPFAISLLSHHRNFPEDDDSDSDSDGQDAGMGRKREQQQQKYLDNLFTPLVYKMGSDGDNMAYLLNMLNKILKHADAAADSSTAARSTSRMHEIAGLAQRLLRAKIKRDKNLSEYPGEIPLPPALFAPGGQFARKASKKDTRTKKGLGFAPKKKLQQRQKQGQSTDSSGGSPEMTKWRKGMKVMGNYQDEGEWFPGKITLVHADGSVDIRFADGGEEDDVPAERARRPDDPGSKSKSSTKTKTKTKKSAVVSDEGSDESDGEMHDSEADDEHEEIEADEMEYEADASGIDTSAESSRRSSKGSNVSRTSVGSTSGSKRARQEVARDEDAEEEASFGADDDFNADFDSGPSESSLLSPSLHARRQSKSTSRLAGRRSVSSSVSPARSADSDGSGIDSSGSKRRKTAASSKSKPTKSKSKPAKQARASSSSRSRSRSSSTNRSSMSSPGSANDSILSQSSSRSSCSTPSRRPPSRSAKNKVAEVSYQDGDSDVDMREEKSEEKQKERKQKKGGKEKKGSKEKKRASLGRDDVELDEFGLPVEDFGIDKRVSLSSSLSSPAGLNSSSGSSGHSSAFLADDDDDDDEKDEWVTKVKAKPSKSSQSKSSQSKSAARKKTSQTSPASSKRKAVGMMSPRGGQDNDPTTWYSDDEDKSEPAEEPTKGRKKTAGKKKAAPAAKNDTKQAKGRGLSKSKEAKGKSTGKGGTNKSPRTSKQSSPSSPESEREDEALDVSSDEGEKENQRQSKSKVAAKPKPSPRAKAKVGGKGRALTQKATKVAAAAAAAKEEQDDEEDSDDSSSGEDCSMMQAALGPVRVRSRR
jgi:hypothetical protein